MSSEAPVEQSEARNWTVAVWVLYLGAHITVITVIAGLIIAYMKRPQFAGTPYESHMTSAIRTFWRSRLRARRHPASDSAGDLDDLPLRARFGPCHQRPADRQS